MVHAGQTLVDEVGQNSAGTDLDERPRTGVPHRLDLFNESHRLGDLVSQRRSHALDVGDIRSCGGVGIDGDLGSGERDRGEELGERSRCATDDFGVKRRGYRESSGGHTGSAESLNRIVDIVGRAREDDLVGRVVVGHDHRQAPCGDLFADSFDRRGHRAHGAVAVGRRLRHQRSASAGNQHRHFVTEHASGTQRGDLTEAVSTDGGRLDAERAQDGKEAEAVGSDARLSPLGPGQLCGLLGTVLVAESRPGPDHLMQVAVGIKVPGASALPDRERWFVQLGQISAHPDVLAPLAREQERHRSGLPG